MNKKILITGGCGFLGQHLVQLLLEKYPAIKIKVLDMREHPRPLFTHKGLVDIAIGKDITVYEQIKEEFVGFDTVVHLAGIVSFSLKDKGLLKKVNVDGTRNVLRAVKENGIKQFIHVSSVAALGYSDDKDHPVTEDYRFDWNLARKRKKYYMLTKHMADCVIKKEGVDAVILHPGLLFGPGDYTNSAKLVNAIKTGRIPFNMPGGTNIIDVRDVAIGIISIIEKNVRKGSYLLSGHNLTFKEINKIIATHVGVKPPKITLPRFMNGLLFHLLLLAENISRKRLDLTADNIDSSFKYRFFDNSKAIQELKWKPKISFSDSVIDTVKWMTKDEQVKR